MPERVGKVKAGRPMSGEGGYLPVDFSSLPVGPDFDLVDGLCSVCNVKLFLGVPFF